MGQMKITELWGEFKEGSLGAQPAPRAHPSYVEADSSVAAVIWHNPSVGQGDVQEMLRKRPAARILLVSTGGATAEHSEEIMGKLARNLQGRMYGCVERNSIEKLQGNAELFGKVVDFLASQDEIPEDPDMAKFLGLDFPVRRLALRVALEIAREELGRDQPQLESLFKPAEELTRGVLELEGIVKEVLRTSQKQPAEVPELKGAVENALKQLEQGKGREETS